MQDTKRYVATGASPLAATLDLVSRSGVGGAGVGLGAPDEPGWTPATDLAADGELLEELLRRTGRGYGTGDRLVEGSFFLKYYLWRVVGSAVAAFLIDRRAPDLGAENLALRFDEKGYAAGLAFVGGRFAALPTDRDAGHPDACILLSEDEVLGWMRDRLASTHLPNLYAALRRSRARRGTRVLWGAAVDAFAEAFVFVGRELGHGAEARAYAERLLSGPPPLSGPTNYYVLEHDGGCEPTRVRNTCCLYYKVGEMACFTCPRTTDEERRQRLAAG